MKPTKRSEPRAHHFVPQCWLAGFTETGQKTGRLWVTDLKRGKQWPSNPENTGHRRDFYRISSTQLDPVVFEEFFSKIEDVIAPQLKSLYEKPRSPRGGVLEDLLFFIAYQYVRVPAFRPWILKMADSIHRAWISEALKSAASWAKALKKIDIPIDSPGASYEDMLMFERKVINKGEYSISAENDWYLMRGFNAAERVIVPSLRARYWGAHVSSSGSFIGSDNPVMLEGPPGRQIGFKDADFVFFPVNRHLMLVGTNTRVRPPCVARSFIAHHNTLTMLSADECVYSHAPDFCWMDENRSYQTDWKLFSKEKILRSLPST